MTELAHAKLSASGFKKWARCTMSPRMERGFEDEDSNFSREGTYAHALAEAILRCYLNGNDGADVEYAQCLADPAHYPAAAEFYNAEFSAYVQDFVDYCIDRIEQAVEKHGEANVTVLLEQRLDFSAWVPEGFGTGDVVIIVPNKVIVIDLKFGKGVFVDVRGNGQLRLYGLGAYHQYHFLYDFNEVEVVIHQPRLHNVAPEVMNVSGPDGLLEWAEQVVRPRAAVAWAALHNDFSHARFAPGEHCSEAFCKARYICGARARYMMELAEQPFSLNDPDTLSVEQLEAVVDKTDVAVKWASDCKGYLLRQAAKGAVELKRYDLVQGRSNRVVKDPLKAAHVLLQNGFRAADIYHEPELVGITQLEKLVGQKKLSELLGDLLHKPEGKPTLALRDAGRKSVSARLATTAQDAFGDLD